MSAGRRLSLVLMSMVFAPSLVFAQYPVTTIRNNGDPANRLDLVVLGDGYSSDDIASGKYANDVEATVSGFLGQQPFAEYARYFNVHRVDAPSAESGVDHPSKGIYRTTAFDATYDCQGITRLICVNNSKVWAALGASVPEPARKDMFVVLVNDTEYGGSGGSIAVASMNPWAPELTLHETAHSFGLLADEYGGPPPPSCNSSSEPSAANVTSRTDRASIKWNGWIDPATPIPTTSQAPGVPGLYQGAMYCDAGLYRPTYCSKMRSVGYPFEQINAEQLVRRIYNWVSPIDGTSPASSSVTLPANGSQAFAVAVPAPATHDLIARWTVDGEAVGTGATFTAEGAEMRAGVHTLTVTVSDETGFVRSDPAAVLKESRSWTVTVGSGRPPLTFTDDPLQPGTTRVKAVHVRELRERIDALRAAGGLSPAAWTDGTLVPGATLVRAAHITELRTALIEAYQALGCAQPSFPPLAAGAPIIAAHVTQLRAAIAAIW